MTYRSSLRYPLALAAMLLAVPAFAQAPAAPPAGAPGAPGAPAERGRMAERMFQALDTNRDGRVTFEEIWAQTQARFSAADANHDGYLTPEEFRAMRPRPPRREGAERPVPEHMQRFIDARFRAADANRDGRVTLEELRPGAEARFRAMDANGDGAITPDELPRHPPRGPHHHRHGGPGGEGPAGAPPAR
ncbi:EF-hand domain-containing protein [Rhodovarius lipocyclicus]|uniref:EF-hand domain-containing protein n=1 Tax=Rhodovarius lipocyclicus TaxID=268410 RepID=UPI00135714AA|nr:EF-hand domain-containing protein [Rhodovarius lipocyclicus]